MSWMKETKVRWMKETHIVHTISLQVVFRLAFGDGGIWQWKNILDAISGLKI